MIDFSAIERDLVAAYTGRLERRRRRRRISGAGALVIAVAGVFATVAIASDIGPNLQLDPTKWTILGGGSTDNGRGAYVHATRIEDGSQSTFMVEHDAGLAPYAAFLLHEQTSPGPQIVEQLAEGHAEQLIQKVVELAEAGERMDWPVSLPVPARARLAATEAPVPPEEPPGVRVRS